MIIVTLEWEHGKTHTHKTLEKPVKNKKALPKKPPFIEVS